MDPGTRGFAAVIALILGCSFDPAGPAGLDRDAAGPGGNRSDAAGPDGNSSDAAGPGSDSSDAVGPDGNRSDAAGIDSADSAGPTDAIVYDAAPPGCPLVADLVACYRFEGDVADDTAYGNDAVAANITFVPGRPSRGDSIAFSATASVVAADSASLDVTTAITIEAWLRADSLPPVGGRMAVLDNNGQYGMFLAPNGQIRCAIGSTTAIGLAVVVGTFTHLACTYDGATIRLYQDGVAGPTIGSTGLVPTGGLDGLGLGQNLPVPPADHLAGTLDDVRIWRVALLDTEICASAGTCP